MLVDFTIKNFRSIRNEQTLSFFAQSNPQHFANSIHYPSSDKVGVLASAGVYGANASGKTTLIRSLQTFLEFIIESHTMKDGDAIEAYQPYRLSEQTKTAPSSFAVEFVVESTRYVYELMISANQVVSERLDFYSQGAKKEVRAKLFERAEGDTWEDITFGTYYKGGSRKFPLFANQAYLSKAGNSPDAPEMIRKVYQYFRRSVVFTHKFSKVVPSWRKSQVLVNQVSAFLRQVDTGIEKIVIEKEARDDLLERLPDDIPPALKDKILEDFSLVPYFKHATEEGREETFTEADESDGTRALFHVLPLLLKVLEYGYVLVWDELESSLHPHISELIVGLFNNPEVNTNHAQLLFTTHNLELMDSSKMRKDQLWLTERNKGATQLISLDEFEARLKHTSPFAKWYDEGRLGGLPAIDVQGVVELFKKAKLAEAEHA